MNLMGSNVTIIGIDCVAQNKDIGLALGGYDGHQCHAFEVAHGR